ncbi:MAG: MoxR family ATPase [Chloroflexi bacterium]|nr:MoxR family ATPase [Chloroflexota bacterium]
MTPKEFREVALASGGRVLVGLEEPFTFLLAALLTNGNVLIEGVPGTAKTLMARVLARLVADAPGVDAFRRIQFTPDLMPSDIAGTNVFNSATATFSLRPGPIFANVVMADEVNRAPAKTQSALLEAMEEHRVTIDGQPLPLPEVFLVIATQNPIEFEGTYPLPEAQLDRFLFKLLVGYGSEEVERDVLRLHHHGFRLDALDTASLEPVAGQQALLDVRRQVAAVAVDETLLSYMVAVERATRSAPEVHFGASIRGAIGLLAGSKAMAAFAGRDFVTPDDVKAVAPAVLRHRVIVKPEAELDGVQPDDVVGRVLANTPVPR